MDRNDEIFYSFFFFSFLSLNGYSDCRPSPSPFYLDSNYLKVDMNVAKNDE